MTTVPGSWDVWEDCPPADSLRDVRLTRSASDHLRSHPISRETLRFESTATYTSTSSNVSQLHSNVELGGSECAQSFDTVSTRSEATFPSAVFCDSVSAEPVVHVEASLSLHRELRRASCPSIVTTSIPVVPAVEGLPRGRRVLSMCSLDHVSTVDAKLTSEERRTRIKESLSKLSASIVSASRTVLDRSSPVRSCPPDSPSTKSHREPSFDDELIPSRPARHDSQRTTTSCTDLLSPVSSIAKDEDDDRLHENLGTFRACPCPSTSGPPTNPSTGLISQLRPHFVPSPAGKELMQIFTVQGSQESMWTAFISRANGPLDFADEARKMPCLVFCLRGLIRFGNGEYGSSRPDALQVCVSILTGRHPVVTSPALLEAVECSAAVVALLAVNPLTRRGDISGLRSRLSFEPIMMAQNGALFQHVVMTLTQTIPKCIQQESVREPAIPQTSRAVSALLETALVYANNPKLRSSWLVPAPPQFKTTVTMLLASLPQKFPPLLSRAIAVLEALLDELGADQQLARQVAQALHAAVQRMPPHSAGEAMHAIRRWAPGTGSTRSRSIGSFFKSLSKSKQSLKSIVYDEYKTLH